MGTCESHRVAALLLLVALAACGGGEEQPATFQLSGRVTTDTGAPVANAQIRVLVTKSCDGGTFLIFNFSGPVSQWFGNATSNASGDYVANVVLNNPCSGMPSLPLRMQAELSVTCGGDKQSPCYVGSRAELWEQSDSSPRSLNFVVSQKSRIFGTIQFPNGINNTVPPEDLYAIIDTRGPVNALWKSRADVDQSNRFWFGPLESGSHTVNFPADPYPCNSAVSQPCNSAYDFTPPSITVDVVPPADLDISFSAVPI